MGAIRTLFTDLGLRADKAVKGLKLYDKLWQQVAKSVETSATAIEKAADRSAAAMARISEGAAALRASAPLSRAAPSGRGGGATAKPKRDPLDAAIKAANVGESRRAGLAAGAETIKDATLALDKYASKTDFAKAKISDFTAQVERNRREVTALKEQTIKTGDADGTLAARMTGLSVATGRAQIELSKAKRELTSLNGGLIATIKSTLRAKVGVSALGHAAGNALSGAVSGGINAIVGGLNSATMSAVDFQSSLVGISKVARGTDDTAAGFERIKEGIKSTSKELGVLPVDVANLTAQLAPAFSGVKEGASETAVDIVKLANDVTKIGVAWDITGKEAGKSFAEISSGLQLTTDQTKSLFGGINEVGNQLGVNAATLAEAVQRSAGVLKGANIAGETGAALSAVLIKTGSSAEVAATGVRTFIGRLGAGETKGQLAAFEALNIDMKELRKNMANGGAEAEIKKVVAALGGLKNEERLGVLAELFGTESIGSIGAAATASDLLAQSMSIMGDKTAAATSVQKEFDRVQETSASKINKLKANVEVLAIQFGEALLPYIDKIVEFLTSPEGQEWGAKAVEKLVSVVTGLGDALGTVIGFFGTLTDTLGGTSTALGALGLAALALTGPFGVAAAAGAAIGYGMAKAYDWAKKKIIGGADEISSAMMEMLHKASDIRHKEAVAAHDQHISDMESAQKGLDDHIATRNKAKDLAKRYEENELKKLGKNSTEKERLRIIKQAHRFRSAVEGENGQLGGGTAEDRVSELERYVESKYPSKKTGSGKRKRGGGNGKTHKQTKMDKQLAAMDPSLRAVLTGSGERDAGGDLKVNDNVLDRAVFNNATGGKRGRGGLDGLAGVGPGPNINNTYVTNNVTTSVTQEIDARGPDSAASNLGAAAHSMGTQVGGVVFTGVAKVLASKQSGGAMRAG